MDTGVAEGFEIDDEIIDPPSDLSSDRRSIVSYECMFYLRVAFPTFCHVAARVYFEFRFRALLCL